MQGLPKMDMLGESDPFVKVLLLIKIIHYSLFLTIAENDRRCSSYRMAEIASALLPREGRFPSFDNKTEFLPNVTKNKGRHQSSEKIMNSYQILQKSIEIKGISGLF